MRFICLFLPALFAAKYEIKENDDLYKKITVYSKYCILINFVMLLLLLVMGRGTTHFEDMCTVNYYVLYLVFSNILAFFIPRILVYCSNNFKFNIKRNVK